MAHCQHDAQFLRVDAGCPVSSCRLASLRAIDRLLTLESPQKQCAPLSLKALCAHVFSCLQSLKLASDQSVTREHHLALLHAARQGPESIESRDKAESGLHLQLAKLHEDFVT
ncbi:hypothetical protein GOP47_0015865 [Adiantum capillus-veneris]|uniref:Uncharacterized protein n=1 Tax=Adiantum capillus-veneris TaxID=13818 RepID=A0A9D4ZC10_ADICA|nr:hypothetical protein GOP47_0015865 [Adiantum capillus-veneris]